MPSSRSKIKSRIKSINATKKITGAMKLISNVKLQKERNRLEKINLYSNELINITKEVFSSEIEFNSIYLKENNANKKFVLCFISDLGMCGAYNANLIRYLKDNYSEDDYLYVIGTHNYNMIKSLGFNTINESRSSDNVEYIDLKMIADEALDMYINEEISEIDIVYTAFINTLTFVPTTLKLLPFEYQGEESDKSFIYIEPNPELLIEDIIILLVRNTFYNKYIESKTSEQASRRLAMEKATDNADELLEKLTLQYNQARQAAITQEITEIVSGADAL